MSLRVLSSENEVKNLIEKLEKTIGVDNVTLLHNNISSFFDMSWEKTMKVDEFVVRFHSTLGRICTLKLNDGLKGHLLLRQEDLGFQSEIL